MKSTIIEGVPDSRIKRLKKYLLKVEREFGKPLRKTPRFGERDCPISNFQPIVRRKGAILMADCYAPGLVEARPPNQGNLFPVIILKIYDDEDSEWWAGLLLKTRYAITHHIQQWIKDGKKL